MSDYTEAENFQTEKELEEYWTKPENFQRLKDGTYGKLNMLYTYKVVLEYKDLFSKFLLSVCEQFVDLKKLNKDTFLTECEEIMKFQNCKFLNFKNNNELIYEFKEPFKFDIFHWILSDFKVLNKNKGSKPRDYTFYLTENKKNTIDTQLKSNKSGSLNSKLRDMTVYTSTDQFFYDVRLS